MTVLEACMGAYPFKAYQYNYIALLEHIVQSTCPVDMVSAIHESLACNCLHK